MIPYGIVFGYLWVWAFLEYVFKKNYTQFIILPLLFLFVALRFETGNDWIPYQRIFDNCPNIIGLLTTRDFYGVRAEDIGFYVYCSVCKTIINDFQVVILSSTVIYLVAFSLFIKERFEARLTIHAIAYSWLLFSLYFSTIAQSLAIAFFMLFWICFDRGKYLISIVCAIVSVAMHASALMYFFVYCAAYINFQKKAYLTLIFPMLIVLILNSVGLDVGAIVFKVVSYVPIEAVQQKAAYYISERNLSTNVFDRLFVLSFTALCTVWLISIKSDWFHKSNVLLRFVIIFVILNALFYNQVVVRYRLFYFGFPLTLGCIVTYYYYSKQMQRFALISFLFGISFLYQFYYLNKSDSITFIPYQNYIYVKVSNDYGDGYYRSMEKLSNKKWRK